MIPPRSPGPAACRAWAGAAILIAAVLLIQAEIKALRSFGNDFTAYLDAAGALASGINPYFVSARFPYSYPLTLAWLFVPLRLLPVWLAAGLWFSVSIWALWRVVTESAAARERLTRCEAIALAVIVAVALIQIVQNELLNGQINLAVAALALAALRLSEQRRPLPAAMLWGLSVALKLFPLVLVPWFIVRRRWTELIGGMGAAAILSLIPTLWIGTDAVRWTIDYFHRISGGEAGAEGVADFIHSNAAWMASHLAGFASTPDWLLVTTSAVLMGGAIAIDLRKGRDAGVQSGLMYLSLVVLLSPKSETHHMVFSIPALVLLAVQTQTMARLIALAGLVIIFNVGFEAAAVRDIFLPLFVCSIAAWSAHDLARS